MLGRVPVKPDLVLDILGFALLVAMVAVVWGAYAFGVAGVACLLVSWRYAS